MTPQSLSIVVPLYREAEQLLALWRSLLPLRSAGVEILLINALSEPTDTDPSLAIAEAAGIPLLTAPRGRARQMNAGAALSQRPWILFLHADTRLPEDFLHLWTHLPSQRVWGRFDVHIQGSSWGLGMVAQCINWRSRCTGIATGDQAIFVRREIFQQLGGFPDQPLMEDIALSRALRRLARPHCLRQRVSTSGRRWDTHGLWPTIFLMWRLRWAYWRGADPQQLARLYR
jgi:rSAM/selenodomain-associated transferase 2